MKNMQKILIFLHKIIRALGNRLLDKRIINPRIFSNEMLRKYADFFDGSVINVSGWDDRDCENGFYKDYFKNISSYCVSNVSDEDKGLGTVAESGVKEIEIDLIKPISEEYKNKFDVVFNHTTLEHVIDVQTAFKNLCELSRDAVIIVVPVIQQLHIRSFGDYWRITTLGIAKLFMQNGFTPLVIKTNDQSFAPIYCFAIGVRNPEKYKDKFEKELDFEMGAALYGSSMKRVYIEKILNKE